MPLSGDSVRSLTFALESALCFISASGRRIISSRKSQEYSEFVVPRRVLHLSLLRCGEAIAVECVV